MTATEELRRLLDERGVEYLASEDNTTIYYADSGYRYTYNVNHDSGWAQLYGYHLTPAQVIEATLGPLTEKVTEQAANDTDAETCRKVYLVETSDDLIESWHPIEVYLHRAAADDCAESLRGEYDGIRQFARVVELKVVDE